MSRFQIILENIARKNGSSAEVLREMQTAIDSAYAGRSDKSQQLWDSMSLNGPHPTAEEFVSQAAALIFKEISHVRN